MPVLTLTPLDDVLSRLKAMSKRQIVHLTVLAFLVLIVVISFFFVKSSFSKITLQNQFLLDSLQHERILLQQQRAALHDQGDSLRMLIEKSSRRDSAYVEEINRQASYLQSINSKLNNLDHAYKDILDVTRYNSDELRKFFTDLH